MRQRKPRIEHGEFEFFVQRQDQQRATHQCGGDQTHIARGHSSSFTEKKRIEPCFAAGGCKIGDQSVQRDSGAKEHAQHDADRGIFSDACEPSQAADGCHAQHAGAKCAEQQHRQAAAAEQQKREAQPRQRCMRQRIAGQRPATQHGIAARQSGHRAHQRRTDQYNQSVVRNHGVRWPA